MDSNSQVLLCGQGVGVRSCGLWPRAALAMGLEVESGMAVASGEQKPSRRHTAASHLPCTFFLKSTRIYVLYSCWTAGYAGAYLTYPVDPPLSLTLHTPSIWLYYPFTRYADYSVSSRLCGWCVPLTDI